MLRVLVTVPKPLRDNILANAMRVELESVADVAYNEDGHNWSAEELASHLEDRDAILASWGLAKLDEAVLSKAPALKIVAYAAGSVKGFATDSLFDRGIALTHAAARIADSVAEFSLLMAMIGLKRPHEFDRQLKSGVEWPKSRDMALYEIAGKRVGLLGMGYVGQRSARLFNAVGADVWVYDPYLSDERAQSLGVHKTTLEDLFRTCKVISNHLPITPETHHLIGGPQFALIQDGAVFVNTARAWTVDQEAMTRDLATGRFWAALDVFDKEPLAIDHALRKMDNVLLTPHVAGLSRDSYEGIMAEMIGELKRFAIGEPLQYQVTREMLECMA